jgi:hypothetical protein
MLVPICHVPVVMEEGRQKCKTLSYTSKFKHEVLQCSEETGNCRASAVFGVDERSNQFDLSQNKFTGPKIGPFPETDEAVLMFFQETRKIAVNCIVLFLWHIKWLYHFSKIQLSTVNLIHI